MLEKEIKTKQAKAKLYYETKQQALLEKDQKGLDAYHKHIKEVKQGHPDPRPPLRWNLDQLDCDSEPNAPDSPKDRAKSVKSGGLSCLSAAGADEPYMQPWAMKRLSC